MYGFLSGLKRSTDFVDVPRRKAGSNYNFRLGSREPKTIDWGEISTPRDYANTLYDSTAKAYKKGTISLHGKRPKGRDRRKQGKARESRSVLDPPTLILTLFPFPPLLRTAIQATFLAVMRWSFSSFSSGIAVLRVPYVSLVRPYLVAVLNLQTCPV